MASTFVFHGLVSDNEHGLARAGGITVRDIELPEFLKGILTLDAYKKWLSRKAIAHVKRDSKRGHVCSPAQYRQSIHVAVVASNGLDSYTGESLDWHLVSTYRNDEAKEGKHDYKSRFKHLPTVDHVSAESLSATFRICSWRTNAAKNDLSHEDLIEFSKNLLAYAGYTVTKNTN